MDRDVAAAIMSRQIDVASYGRLREYLTNDPETDVIIVVGGGLNFLDTCALFRVGDDPESVNRLIAEGRIAMLYKHDNLGLSVHGLPHNAFKDNMRCDVIRFHHGFIVQFQETNRA